MDEMIRASLPEERRWREDVCSEKPKTVLYHYTDTGGMLGMLNKKNVWLTDFRFMNDQKEFSYGLEVALDAILMFSDQYRAEPRILELLRLLNDGLRSLPFMYRPFVFCLTSRKDDLNQWRVYGGRDGGYSLGFHVEYSIASLINGLELRRVIYDLPTQHRIIRSIILDAIEKVLAGQAPGAKLIIGLGPADMALLEIAVRCSHFKHEAFRDEDEWRIVATHHYGGILAEPREIMYRAGRYGLTPYLDVQWGEVGLNLEEAFIGASSHADLNQQAFRDYCGTKDYKISVWGSKAPYRP